MIDKEPWLIVKYKSQRDIMAAINYAKEKVLDISVRSDGHNSAGFFGLSFAPSPMKYISWIL